MTPSTELTLFTFATIVGCIHSLVCLPWKFNHNMDIESVLLSSWLLVGSFVFFVNSLAMNAPVWCDISTKLMIGAYIGVPASIVCVLHRLYATISAPDSLPEKKFYQLLCKLALMLGMPALIIIVHIIVQDRRYIFIEQAGCIPSISPSLVSLVAVLIWPLLFNVASLAYFGLVMYSFWAKRRTQGTAQTSPGTMTVVHFLRLSISLFFGIVCTVLVPLSLLMLITHIPGISVNSLHHDFQTVYILPVAQWSIIPGLRGAVELRWLWSALNPVLSNGLFPQERIDRLVGWVASARMYVRMRVWHRSTWDEASHGSLPVYISGTETPIIPSIVRQSTLAPTFGSRVSSMQPFPPELLPHTPELDLRSKLSQVGETIQPIEHSGPGETSQPNEPPQPNQYPHQSESVPIPATSALTLADSIRSALSLERASSYQTCESTRC